MNPGAVVVIRALLIGLAGLLSWFILVGLRGIGYLFYRAVLAVVHPSRSTLSRLTGGVVGIGAVSVDTAVHRSEDVFGKEAQQFEPSTSGFVAHLAGVIEYNAFTLAYVAESTLEALHGLRNATIPKLALRLTRPWRQIAVEARRIGRLALHRATAAEALGADSLRYADRRANEAETTATVALGAAVGIAIPGELDWTRTREGTWYGDTIRTLRRRLGLVETAVGAGALALVGLRAITRYAPWARCTNVNRFNRALCRSPFHFVDDLIGLLLDFAVLTNICRVIPWLVGAYESIAAPMVAELTSVAARVCAPEQGQPATYSVPTLHLPESPGFVLYLP